MGLRTPNYKRLKKKRIGFYQATFWLAELHQTPETGLPHICQGRCPCKFFCSVEIFPDLTQNIDHFTVRSFTLSVSFDGVFTVYQITNTHAH